EQDFDTSVSGVSGGAGASVPAVNRQVVSANSANFHHFLSEADNVSLTENGAVGHGQGRGFVVHLGGQLRFVREQFVLNPFVFRGDRGTWCCRRRAGSGRRGPPRR